MTESETYFLEAEGYKFMKKRVFSLDFIRALATILIVITHFNARYIWVGTAEAYQKMIIGATTFNIYIGSLGVSLFLIISGSALMLTYGESFELKSFFIKRFWSIYPMFWIAYFFAFLHQFYQYRCVAQTAPKANIILSVLGMDGYLSNAGVPTFYLLGEWFLGFIIIAYIVFPVLRWGVLKHPVVTGVISLMLCGLTIYNYSGDFPSNMIFTVRLPEIIFGMCFQKYIKKVKLSAALVSAAVLILNTVLAPTVIPQDIQTLYVGIAAFLLLYYLGNLLQNCNLITGFCAVICKYSYAIFMVHHYIIGCIMGKFDLNTISILESWLLFILICCVVGFFAKLLFECNKYVLARIK